MLARMINLFHSIFSHQDAVVDRAREQLVNQATQRAIDVIDKRLNALSNSHARIRGAVEIAIDHVVTMANAFPEPVNLTYDSYRSQPLLNALFASPDHLHEVVVGDAAIKSASSHMTARGDLYALLISRMSRRHFIGPDLIDGALRQDVALTAVSFDHHHFLDVSPDESQTRVQLKKRAYDVMLKQILEEVEARHQTQQTLQGQRKLLQRKLELLHRAGWHFTPSSTGEEGLGSVEAQLHKVEASLAELGAPEQTLENHLTLLKHELEHPAQLLALESVSTILDLQNIERASESDQAHPISLNQLVDRHQNRFVVTPLRIDFHILNG